MSNVVALNKFLHRKNLVVCFLLLAQSKPGLVQQVPPGVAGWVNSSCGRVWPQSPERSKRRNQHTVSDSGQTASHAWGHAHVGPAHFSWFRGTTRSPCHG